MLALGVKNEKAAATGSGNLSAQRAIFFRECVEFVEARIRDARRHFFLGLPVPVELASESREISRFEHFADAIAHLLDRVQAFADL